MIKVESKTNVFITSDTHYSHQNICRGVTNWRDSEGNIPINSTRPFESIEDMNDGIVNSINRVVKENDILIHLGDWSFGGFDKIKEFRDRIVCKNIHLILGNHDHHIENDKDGIRKLFISVSHYNTLSIDSLKFRLMHYPISSWDGINMGNFHLHGHCHLPSEKRFGKGRRMDVGLDGSPEFRPYHIMDEIVPILKIRPSISDIDNDHHSI